MTILDRFPKRRPELEPAYRRVHHAHYLSNREGRYVTSAVSLGLERWMHRKVAEDVRGRKVADATLEIGAGTLNHLDYEPEVRVYDIVEPFGDLYQGSPRRARVRNVYQDIGEVPDGTRYDRITSIATFEHVLDLPVVVARAALLLREEGVLRVAIPNEGSPAWRLGTMVTGLEFRIRYGLDYQVVMRHEHVNGADEIDQVLRCFFDSCTRRLFGVSRVLALYRFYACRNPRRDAASAYLRARTSPAPEAAGTAEGA